MQQNEMTRPELPLAARAMALRAFKQEGSTDARPLATADLVFTTGAAVMRYDYLRDRAYLEELVVSDSAIRLDRLKRGAPLLDTHNAYSLDGQIGVVENPRIVGGVGECTVTFSRREEVAGYVQDVADGIIRNVSVGYARHRVEMLPPTNEGDPWRYQVVDWEPIEVSLVPIPADMDAQVRGHGPSEASGESPLRTFPCEFIEVRSRSIDPGAKSAINQQGLNMKGNQRQTNAHEHGSQAVEAADEIRDLVRRHSLPSQFGDDLVGRGLGVEAAGRAILDELARRDHATGGHQNIDRRTPSFASRVSIDSAGGNAIDEGQREMMVEALAARMGGPALRGQNQYRHVRVADMARDCLELRGINTTSMSNSQLIERSLHTTSDFPNLLTGAGQRTLRHAYEVYQGGLKRACRPSTAPDFRAKQRLQLGEAPTLLPVNEHGEYKYGTMAESKGSYSLGTFGRIFGITRQALINDDLNAFGDMAVRFGRAAAEFEATFLVTLLTSNPVMYDTVALFHANHGNLATGGPSALQFTSLVAARKSMRLQKGLDGVTPIDATPSFLIVPAALETTAEQLLAQLQATTINDVNPFSGKLDLIVDPRLDATSSTAWYLAADPALVDTIEYSYLESAQGPEVIAREGFEIDGVEMKVRLDYGAGAIDWRGLYKANGA